MVIRLETTISFKTETNQKYQQQEKKITDLEKENADLKQRITELENKNNVQLNLNQSSTQSTSNWSFKQFK